MQIGYVHALQKTTSLQNSRRSVLLFRHGNNHNITHDSGTPLHQILQPSEHPLTPRVIYPSVTYGHSICSSITAKEGMIYSREYLFKKRLHRQDMKGVNGNENDGCDSIIISDQNSQLVHMDDNIETFIYACTRVQGSMALYTSYQQKFPIRVFRSSKSGGSFSPLALYDETKNKAKSSYRYDGLYSVAKVLDIISLRDIRLLPKDALVKFQLNRNLVGKEKFCNLIGIDSLKEKNEEHICEQLTI
mmetsp:Transcript_2783/g.3945  ORF Transcript_2783/g.3945 Transcript_2783/m.3945 type:complete len:246 (+) Transcript_2783:48-785(+)